MFNPTAREVTVSADDFSLVLGFIPEPTGRQHHPGVSETVIAAGRELDFTLEFPYAGEGYARLTMLGRVWGVEM